MDRDMYNLYRFPKKISYIVSLWSKLTRYLCNCLYYVSRSACLCNLKPRDLDLVTSLCKGVQLRRRSREMNEFQKSVHHLFPHHQNSKVGTMNISSPSLLCCAGWSSRPSSLVNRPKIVTAAG